MIGSSVPRQSPAAGTPDQPRELDFATSGRIRRRQTSREWISEALVYLELARSRRSLLNQSEPAVTLVLQPGWSTRCLNSRVLCRARNPQLSYRFPCPLNNHIGQRQNPGGGKSVTCQPRRCIGMPLISTGTRISRRKRLIATAAPWPTARLPCLLNSAIRARATARREARADTGRRGAAMFTIAQELGPATSDR